MRNSHLLKSKSKAVQDFANATVWPFDAIILPDNDPESLVIGKIGADNWTKGLMKSDVASLENCTTEPTEICNIATYRVRPAKPKPESKK